MNSREFLTKMFYEELDKISATISILPRVDPIADLTTLVQSASGFFAILEVMDDATVFEDIDSIDIENAIIKETDAKIEEYKSQLLSYTD